MHISKRFSSLMLAILMATVLVNCEDSMLEKNRTVGDKTWGVDEGYGPNYLKAPRGRYSYPEIIKREYIPREESFDDTKCLAWRITWPEYDDDADQDLIPTVFSIANGALHSFNFLNNTSPSNTYNGDFSLYYGDKVHAVYSMWSELDYVAVGFDQITAICLSESSGTLDLEDIIYWVTSRPSFFEIHWPGACEDELEYDEGDFIQFMSNDDGVFRYGGIRIVSMTPRIIEVYLAVPNI